MKKVFVSILFILTNLAFSQQETFEDELIIHLINYNNSSVTATATRVQLQGAKWYPSDHEYAFQLIEDSEFDVVVSGNKFSDPYWTPRIIFDLEHDQNPDKTLAVSFYKISFNLSEAFFYVNTVSTNFLDVHVTFDKANDKIYWGDCTSCTNEITNTDIFYTFDTQNTVGLEDYWENGLYAVLEHEEQIKPNWSKFPTNNTIQKYRLYKALNDSETPPNDNQFQWISDIPNNQFSFEDKSVCYDGGNKYVHYFIKAYYYNGSSYVWSDKTNVVFWQTQYNWQNTLNVGRSDTHPRIVWWPYPASGYSVDSYKIYRSVTSPSVPPQTPSYSLLATVGSNQFTYNDEEYSSGNQILHYYVTAVLVPLEDGSPLESEASNVVVTTGGLYKQMEETTTQPILENFLLFDNYPNPFNPTTTISYNIPQRSNVSLKVFDILGREVQELVNGVREAGENHVQFNAESLSSGVYIYTITASNGNSILFRESKQMILMK